MSEHSLTLEASIRAARERGLVIRYPKPNELFVDIDSNEAWKKFEKNFEIIRAEELCEGNLISCTVAYSKSGHPHRHVVVDMRDKKFSPSQRINMQALLGSDPTHELLSMVALKRGHPKPTMFFERS